jgi:hypothetical protein
MTTVRELVTDLDDSDVAILKTLTARLACPDQEDRWPRRVESFWHELCAGLDDELCRRVRELVALEVLTDEDGTGALVGEDAEDLSGWTDA